MTNLDRNVKQKGLSRQQVGRQLDSEVQQWISKQAGSWKNIYELNVA